MHAAERQVDRPVLSDQMLLVVPRDEGRAVHYDPMLGAVIVLLQRKPRSGLDRDPFHLEAIARVDGLVESPGSVDAKRLSGNLAAHGLQPDRRSF